MPIDFTYRSVKADTMEGLRRYIDHHIPTGHFLEVCGLDVLELSPESLAAPFHKGERSCQ